MSARPHFRSWRHALGFVGTFGAALLSAVAPARAAPTIDLAATPGARVAVRVAYSAPLGCPGAAEFEGQLYGRTAKARAASSEEPAHVFRVDIRQENGVVVGRVVIEHDGERSGARILRGKTCAEVAEALTLTAALSIDPDARLVLNSDRPPEKGDPAMLRPSSAVGGDADPATNAPSRPPAAAAHWRFGADAGLARVVTPGVLPTLSLFDEVAWAGTEAFSPALRLSMNLATNTLESSPAATFTWFTGQVEACPLAAHLGRAVELRPCAALQAGGLFARGRTVAEPHAQARPWWSAGARAHLSRLVSPHFGVELLGGLSVPFRQRSFVFEVPERQVARTAPAVLEMSIGIFVLLP